MRWAPGLVGWAGGARRGWGWVWAVGGDARQAVGGAGSGPWGSGFALLLAGGRHTYKVRHRQRDYEKDGRRSGDHARLRPVLMRRLVPLDCIDLSFVTDK